MLNRRNILLGAGAAAFGLSDARALAQALTDPTIIKQRQSLGGDLAVLNARIWTLDPARPRAQAALVRAGRVVAVGSNAEVLGQAGRVRRFDAGGRTVVPGFIDAHCHVELAAPMYSGLEVSVHTPPLTSLEEIFGRLRERAAKTPEGRWIVARGGFGMKRQVKEQRWATRQELDAVSTRHPIIVLAGMHVAMMNTLGFERTGLLDIGHERALRWKDGRARRGTDLPRDADGMPTGVVSEIFDIIPADIHTREERKQALASQVVPVFTSKGITSVGTMPMTNEERQVDQELQQEGKLPMRIRTFPIVPFHTTVESLVQNGLVTGLGDDMYKFGGIKIYVGGGSVDVNGQPMNDLKYDQEALTETLWRAHDGDIQAIMHQSSRHSYEITLRAAEAAIARKPVNMRHRLEHAAPRELQDVEQIRRMRRLGLRLAITGPTTRATAPRSGAPRYATMAREGLQPFTVSDATGTTPVFSPLAAIAGISAPQSEGGMLPPQEALNLEDALRSYTVWAAAAQFEEQDKGWIRPGNLGDFAVLDADLERVRGGALFDAKVDATILGGRVVYER
ncbi:amidohydrolase [Phenylobacterium sp.]|jgi:predicted amidohydrolase YtcJ|uniref:amidohydrolase n=1 Tax=Phenylobacterium sp. TaxID=1871053 RepID=UPI003784FCA1